MVGRADAARVSAVAGSAVRSGRLKTVARVGYVVSGLLHILIGWLALQVAWSYASQKADQSGALATIAGKPYGAVLLWVAVAGFAGLAAWQAGEALHYARTATGGKAGDVAKAVGKAVVYAALAFTSLKFALGGRSSSAQQSTDFTASMLGKPGGRILVVAIGLAIIGVGVYHVRKGVTKSFLRDLSGGAGGTVGRVVQRLGVAGYVSKGVVLGIVGVLFVLAGAHRSAGEATGLDGALKTLRDQPFGQWLLTMVAVGLVAYGTYSFARARYARL